MTTMREETHHEFVVQSDKEMLTVTLRMEAAVPLARVESLAGDLAADIARILDAAKQATEVDLARRGKGAGSSGGGHRKNPI